MLCLDGALGQILAGPSLILSFWGRRVRLSDTKKSPPVWTIMRGLLCGMTAVLHEAGLSGGDIAEVLHGTTVASNAILELKGAGQG